jgi:hypothetical protein
MQESSYGPEVSEIFRRRIVFCLDDNGGINTKPMPGRTPGFEMGIFFYLFLFALLMIYTIRLHIWKPRQ